jgi:hypothetical protein
MVGSRLADALQLQAMCVFRELYHGQPVLVVLNSDAGFGRSGGPSCGESGITTRRGGPAMPAKRKQPTPLERFDSLLGQLTNDELLEVIVRAFEEGGDRLENYGDLIEEAETPRDIVNEAIVLGVRLTAASPTWIFVSKSYPRLERACRRISDWSDYLKGASLVSVGAEGGDDD